MTLLLADISLREWAGVILILLVLGIVLFLLRRTLDAQVHAIIIAAIVVGLALWIWKNIGRLGLALLTLPLCSCMILGTPVGVTLGYENVHVGLQFQPRPSGKNPITPSGK